MSCLAHRFRRVAEHSSELSTPFESMSEGTRLAEGSELPAKSISLD
jgi:hypothetical protein